MDETNEKMTQNTVGEETKAVENAYTGPVIYIGPSFRNSRLNHCMIFSEIPVPEGEDSVLKHLFVKPAELNDALRAVEKKGTALNTFYQKAIRNNKGGN